MSLTEPKPTLPWYVLYDRGIETTRSFTWDGQLPMPDIPLDPIGWIKQRWPEMVSAEVEYVMYIVQGLDPEDGEPWPIGRGDPRVYHHGAFRSPEQASRAVAIGRCIRPDIWWCITNKDAVWQAIGYHLSPEEMRPGQVPRQ